MLIKVFEFVSTGSALKFEHACLWIFFSILIFVFKLIISITCLYTYLLLHYFSILRTLCSSPKHWRTRVSGFLFVWVCRDAHCAHARKSLVWKNVHSFLILVDECGHQKPVLSRIVKYICVIYRVCMVKNKVYVLASSDRPYSPIILS